MKYKLSFTLAEYQEILAALLARGISFRGFDALNTTERAVYLRHDVDNELFLLSDMARLEADAGISSTYFLMTQSTAYNLNSVDAKRAITELKDLGHSIGLHYMNEGAEDFSFDEIVDDLLFQVRIIERIAGDQVKSFSFHQPTQNMLDIELAVPGLVNVYGLKKTHGVFYTSDTNMEWRSGHPLDLVDDGVNHLQVLVHPMWWTSTQLPTVDRWKRVRDSIVDVSIQHWKMRERSFVDFNSDELEIPR